MTTNDLLSAAKKYLGKKYVWGGESDAEGGYDCSGYVWHVLKDCGYTGARTTAQGLSKLGASVTSKQAGDLLFFGKSKDHITHVAIYAGDNKMYESIGDSTCTKTKPGKGVVLDSVNRRSDLVLVTRICTTPKTKSVEEVAREVLKGKWGNGSERKAKLTAAGYDYKEVQNMVNKLIRG